MFVPVVDVESPMSLRGAAGGEGEPPLSSIMTERVYIIGMQLVYLFVHRTNPRRPGTISINAIQFRHIDVILGSLNGRLPIFDVTFPSLCPSVAVIDQDFISLPNVCRGDVIEFQSGVIGLPPFLDGSRRPFRFVDDALLVAVSVISFSVIDVRRSRTVGTEQQRRSVVSETIIEKELRSGDVLIITSAVITKLQTW